MKITISLIVLLIMMSIGFGTYKAEAILAVSNTTSPQDDEDVRGVFEGYKNNTLNILLRDGTRRAYPFKPDKYLLRIIAGTKLHTKVAIKVENGIVLRFERIY